MRETRTYSAEVKAEVVKMVLEQGVSQREVGRRLSIPTGSIANWISAAKGQRVAGDPGERTLGELAAEVAKLRKELAEARMEREILGKAVAYFSKESPRSTRS